MKRILNFLTLCLWLAVASCGVATSGCATTATQTSYKTADAVISSVDLAMRGWADYVVAERRKTRSMDPIERGSRDSDLLRKEGKVFTALGRYQGAMLAAEAAVKLATSTGKPLPEQVQLAASALLALITEVAK